MKPTDWLASAPVRAAAQHLRRRRPEQGEAVQNEQARPTYEAHTRTRVHDLGWLLLVPPAVLGAALRSD